MDHCNISDICDFALLQEAILCENNEIFYLIDDKFFALQHNEHGSTPLHYALCAKRVQIATVISQKVSRENIIIQDKSGCTPLHLAAFRGYIDIVYILLGKMYPKDRVIKDNHGKTALDYATTDEMKALLQPCPKRAISE